jgi:hypothetical protein
MLTSGKAMQSKLHVTHGVRAMTTLITASFDYAQCPGDAREMCLASYTGPVNTISISDPKPCFLLR